MFASAGRSAAGDVEQILPDVAAGASLLGDVSLSYCEALIGEGGLVGGLDGHVLAIAIKTPRV